MDKRKLFAASGIIILSFFAAPPSSSASETRVCLEHLPGIDYVFYGPVEPRVNRVHVLTVDITPGEIEPVVVIAEESPREGRNAVRTDPRKLAENPRLMAFVNTNPWSPWVPEYPVDVSISGLAASGGRMRGKPDKDRVSVWVDEKGLVNIGYPDDYSAVTEGAGGFSKIIKDFEVIAEEGGSLAPRTAIGVNCGGSRMWLVVVEGRNPGVSEGMTVEELAVFMREELGCRRAANMDGGGSSVMGVVNRNGEMLILDGPPGRYLRPLPVILTIRSTER